MSVKAIKQQILGKLKEGGSADKKFNILRFLFQQYELKMEKESKR